MNSIDPDRDFRKAVRAVVQHMRQGREDGFFELRVVGRRLKQNRQTYQVSYSPTEQYTITEELPDE